MPESKGNAMGALGTVVDVLAIPYNLLAGLILGLVIPIAAIAAAVAGVRLLTGKMPFVALSGEGTPERSLAVSLVPPEQAGEMFAVQKEKMGGEIARMQTEIRKIVEEARAEASRAAAEAKAE